MVKEEPQPPVASESAAPAAAAPEARVGGQTAQAAASATVSTGDNFYSPASVSVFVGDTVTWTNTGSTQHSATADDGSFDTGIFGAGQSRSQTFSSPGTFSYFCTVHGQSQSGTVTVRAATGDAGGGGGNSGGGGGAAGAASGPSEAAAVAAPDAAGTSASLPSTGFPALILGVIGFALLGSGVAAGRKANAMEHEQRRADGPLFSIF